MLVWVGGVPTGDSTAPDDLGGFGATSILSCLVTLSC